MLWERVNDVRLVKPDNGEISVNKLPERISTVRLVKPDRGVRSEMILSESNSDVRLVKPDRSVISEMILLERFSDIRPVANSSPVKSRISESCASRRVKLAISALLIDAPLALRSAVSIAARRSASGMVTCVSGPPPPSLDVDTSLPKLLLKSRKSPKPIAPSLSRSYFASYLPSP